MGKEAGQLGHYQFGGMHGSHPFYIQTPRTRPVPASPGPATTTVRPPTGKTEPMFLFYNAAKQQWVVGKTLGTTSGLFFGTTEKSPAKCPGDSSSRGTWQTATATFGRWKLNSLVTIACQTTL